MAALDAISIGILLGALIPMWRLADAGSTHTGLPSRTSQTFAPHVSSVAHAPTRAVAVTSVVSLVDIAIHWFTFGFERMIGLGLAENLLQLALQSVFAGAGATYLFTRSVVLLGTGRAAAFPSLVPGFTLLIGFLALGEVPSLAQLAGFAIVLAGFRLTQRN